VPADIRFWRGELARSKAVAEPLWPGWQTNVDYYTGTSADAKAALASNRDYVNINADFYQVELKRAQLFFERPDLQLERKGTFFLADPMTPEGKREATAEEIGVLLHAHKILLNELLGPDHADVLTTVKLALKDCLCPSGFGATKIGYEPTVEEMAPPPQLGDMMGLKETISKPIHESWYWNRIPAKKYRIPAEFSSTDYDKAPWLAMDFRMPLTLGRRAFTLPPDFQGTRTRDDRLLNDQAQGNGASDLAYLDGTELWYYAAQVDGDAIHPQLIRRHVLVEGVDAFVEKSVDSPYQTLLPTGRLSGDSMIGFPIHVWTLRDVPDSAYPPSDCTMTRPLVRELCTFRTQMVQARDANRPRVLYDAIKLPPAVIDQIAAGTLGDLIAVEEGALAQGIGAIMQQVAPATTPRETFTANDYIQRDLDKTLGIDAAGAGIADDAQESATKTNEISRNRNVRINAEQRQALGIYLKGVAKFSALVLRYMTPELATPYVGAQAAQLWGAWDKQGTDHRIAFDAKPDSQLSLDAAVQRKFWLDIYQFVVNDPGANRTAILSKLIEVAGENPQEFLTSEVPEEKPKSNFTFAFKGEDLIGPQAPIVLEILAQNGLQISPDALAAAQDQLLQAQVLGVRDASGAPVPAATKTPAPHGGPAEQVRPLSQQTADRSNNRPAPQEVGA
jgi:hypothetical protein